MLNLMPTWLNRRRYWEFRSLVSKVGLKGAVKVFLSNGKLGFNQTCVFHPPHITYPVLVRGGQSSDIDVYLQIFVDEEYACIRDIENVGLIFDCGANVGYSSAYFLSCFPNATVIAIEPQAKNFAILTQNLLPYGSRARALRAAVWSCSTELVENEEPYRDGREWAFQVREAVPGEKSDLRGVDIGSLLADSGFDKISLLKMDIEGAEAIVFSSDCDAWLSRTDAVVIELHDDSHFGSGSEVFLTAIKNKGFTISRAGELTICRR